MTEPYAPMYYVSKEPIEQLYRSRFGPPKDITTFEKSGAGTWIGARVRLNKLLSYFFDVEAEGGFKAVSEAAQWEEMARADTDFILKMVHELFDSELVEDVSEMDPNGTRNDFYSFTLPMAFSSLNEDQSVWDTLLFEEYRENMKIRATHDSPDLHLTGITSADNWTTSSMLANFFDSIDDEECPTVEVAGLIHPTKKDMTDGKLNIKGHLLFLCSPTINED